MKGTKLVDHLDDVIAAGTANDVRNAANLQGLDCLDEQAGDLAKCAPAKIAALEAELADALNAQHAAGLREDDIAGGALLSYTPGAAAASLAVVVSGPSELAVATSSEKTPTMTMTKSMPTANQFWSLTCRVSLRRSMFQETFEG